MKRTPTQEAIERVRRILYAQLDKEKRDQEKRLGIDHLKREAREKDGGCQRRAPLLGEHPGRGGEG